MTDAKILAAAAAAGLLTLALILIGMLVFAGDTECPEGQTYELGAPITQTVGGVVTQSYPFAGCR